MHENRFLLFINHLRSAYSVLKSFALLLAFHISRHSYATLQLAGGTDIYTVSKMLGHTNVRTTQIYAKVIDAKKEKATETIKLDLSDTE